jgi:hypothetical protein
VALAYGAPTRFERVSAQVKATGGHASDTSLETTVNDATSRRGTNEEIFGMISLMDFCPAASPTEAPRDTGDYS